MSDVSPILWYYSLAVSAPPSTSVDVSEKTIKIGIKIPTTSIDTTSFLIHRRVRFPSPGLGKGQKVKGEEKSEK